MSEQQSGQVRQVDEREARQTAEEARQTSWQQPSFGKQLFLGDFQLGLIHPHPRPAEEAVRRGEEFCARLREFCETSVDGMLIEREARIPDDVVKGLAATGAASPPSWWRATRRGSRSSAATRSWACAAWRTG